MALEPLNVFARKIDPRGVIEVLRRFGAVKVTGPEDDWQEVEVTLPKKGFFSKAPVLVFGHDAEYYDGDDWPNQVLGMQGYFSRFPETPLKPRVMQAIRNLRFALTLPRFDLDIYSNDERLQVLYAVVEHLDGVIFTPSALRDARGRVLLAANGEYDEHAVLPTVPPGASPVDDDPDESGEEDEEHEYKEPIPHSPERVARRALALTAVAARATLELDRKHVDEPDKHRQRILTWIEETGFGDELEPDEWEVVQRPVGRLEQQSFINSMWRVEGLAVLAWALQLHELPPDDTLITPTEIYQSMGLFDSVVAGSILANPQLRESEELKAMHTHLIMLHWRLRNYSLRPEAMDFVAFSKDCWFGTFDINTFRILKNDLAIGDAPIAEAPEEAVSISQSIAMERHLAANWLHGESDVYSETDTPT